MSNIIINAENQVLGRIAAYAAKQALLGNKVNIINSEKAIITGKRNEILAKYKRKRSMGVPKKGPFFPKNPDRFLKRTIRGMLPYKKPRGRKAFQSIKCHVGVPSRFEGEDTQEPEGASVRKLSNLKYVTVGSICKELGASF